MELEFFTIPARDSSGFSEELNKFLRGHRVLVVQRELVKEESGSYWAVCVEYLPPVNVGATIKGAAAGGGKPKVDYREVLNAEDFAVFSRLRELRKQLAEKEAVPVYAVFTNEQLAAMVTGRVDSLATLGKISGIGKSRVEKYGGAFLSMLKSQNAASPQNDPKEKESKKEG